MKDENPNNDSEEKRENVKVLNSPIRSTSTSIGDVKLTIQPYIKYPRKREFNEKNCIT